jgi:hypothetical protein
MNVKHLLASIPAWLLLPCLAHAQSQASSADESPVMKIVYAFLPLLILGAFIYLGIRWAQSGPRTRRMEQHMERVEQSLERIAEAVERKDKDGG